jgi:hypothetical protein
MPATRSPSSTTGIAPTRSSVKTASAWASVAVGGRATGSGVIASAIGSASASARAPAKSRASVPRRARRSPSEIIPTSRPSPATTGT